MNKRIAAVFSILIFVFGCVALRLGMLAVRGTDYVASMKGGKTIELYEIRGDILDCRGRKLTGMGRDNYVMAKPTLKALDALKNSVDSECFGDAKARMSRGNPISINIGENTIPQNPDAVMMRSIKRYSENCRARHLIGYLDSEGHGVTGLERCFDDILYTGRSFGARFGTDAQGKVINGLPIEQVNGNLPVGSVTVTIDRDIQEITENALDLFSVEQGAAVIIDVRTGAIRAMASRPDFSQDNVAASLGRTDSPLMNRALEAHAVGSVFKTAIAAAALESGTDDFLYECKGSCNIDGITFSCHKGKPHGKLNMQKALECSCNCYFIELARKAGAESILETASLLGFGHKTELAENIVSQAGIMPAKSELALSGALANFSFGQGRFTATMLQTGQMMCAVASGGKYMIPYLIEKATDAEGRNIIKHKQTYPVAALSEKTAETLSEMLVNVVERGNASGAGLANGFSAGGKTATAQTGRYRKNGTEICNTWFAGFFPADAPEYAVVILKEGGRSGAEDCAPVFKSIADKILKLNTKY